MTTHRLATLLLMLVMGGCSTSRIERDGASDPPAYGGVEAETYQVPPALDDGWRTGTPEDIGLNRASLEQTTEALRGGMYPNVHAVLIAKDGRLVYEEYFAGTDRRWRDGRRGEVWTVFDRDTLHEVRSVTKSVTSAVFGIAVGTGAIESLDQPVLDFFPEHADFATPEKSRITLRHVLTMSAGLDWNEWEVETDDPHNHENIMYTRNDPAGFVLGRPMETEPGARWAYNGGLTTLLGYVISRATGQSFGEYARERLFAPLGITKAEWGWQESNGVGESGENAWKDVEELRWNGSEPWSFLASPSTAFWIRPRDLLKIGSLYLNGGIWNGLRVLPEEWVEQSTRNHIDRPESPEEHGEGASARVGYGYQWYVERWSLPYGDLTVHAAKGNGSQRIWVVPELGLTAVQVAGNYHAWKANYIAERVLLERIVPWALGIQTAYKHELGRPVLIVGPGEWPLVDLDPEDRAIYVGVYDQAGDRLEISDETGVLQLTLPGAGIAHLIPDRAHVFAAGRIQRGQVRKVFWPDERIVFVLDDEGKVLRYEWMEVGTGKVTLIGKREHKANE